MLKILLKLWWIQKRRTFDWKRLGLFIYMMLCVIVGLGAGYWQAGGELDQLTSRGEMGLIIIPFVVILSPFELWMKLLLKTDAAGMDDYLRSKPIPKATWNHFLLVTNLVDYLNWFIPVMVLIIGKTLMPIGYALLAFSLSLTQNFADGLMITGIRKAQGWEYKLPLWLMLLFYYCISALFMIFFMHWLGAIGSTIAWFFITLGFGISIYAYLCYVKHYNEQRSQTSKVGRIGGSSLFSMEYISLLRSKRLLRGELLLLGIMSLQAYIRSMGMDPDNDLNGGEGIYVFMTIMFSSLILGQWVFSIEGNFFHGLMTKPISVFDMLWRKFWFFILLNLTATLLLVPGIFLGYWSPLMVLSAFIFCAGVNLLYMPTSLFSKRIDLFSSAFFNYQGASMGVNVYAFVIIIPIIIYSCLIVFIDNTLVVDAILSAIGLIMLAFSRPFIQWVAHRFMAKKYKRMEDFMK